MTTEELKEILDKHEKWLNGEDDGVKANLFGADLEGADLRGADLIGADLIGANLYGADLRRADLRRADLRRADLIEADLRGANLIEADLYGANLRRADLEGADLRGADLIGADLIGANLYGADLEEADLRRAINIPEKVNLVIKPIICPEKGSFIGWKKVRIDGKEDRIIELQITENAKRSSATSRKCRCSEAKVISIQMPDGSQAEEKVINHYAHGHITKYAVGEMVYPDSFDDNRWNECSNGIHFFVTRAEALNY